MRDWNLNKEEAFGWLQAQFVAYLWGIETQFELVNDELLGPGL